MCWRGKEATALWLPSTSNIAFRAASRGDLLKLFHAIALSLNSQSTLTPGILQLSQLFFGGCNFAVAALGVPFFTLATGVGDGG